MLAKSLKGWAKREREEGRVEGWQEGRLEAAQQTARNLIKLGVLSDAQIAQATGLSAEQIAALRLAEPH